MRRIEFNLLLLFCLMCLWGCSRQDDPQPDSVTHWTEQTVAVVLPSGNGLDAHWKRTLGMFAANFERAFKNQQKGIKLNFEFYDESTADISLLSKELSRRDDVYAVIGGLYSSNAAELAARLTTADKTYFTLATAERLVRAYASTGNLWAMTETDITQCEVLLSKVINYGGKSVALLAKDNDAYGQTFIDWFAFQSKEFGLENKGVFAYDESTLVDMTRRAVQSGAEYVVCIPSEVEEMEPMLRSGSIQPKDGSPKPRLLFSDTAYGSDVLAVYGKLAEGMEGVAFGSDPESGFDVSYRTFFNDTPTLGETQLYDAAMLIGYAAWLRLLNPELSLKNALRKTVSGESLNMGSWTGEDMGLVVDALARGETPYVKGASGHLRFDSKVFTNVLSTTYHNFKVYNGQYIILDYNTSDGGNRTDATLAGWNWKASQLQNFDTGGEGIAYPEHKGNWALLVATSSGWKNYRHQADVLAIYRQLKSHGYTDDRIILILEDDIAYNPSNPDKGVVRVTPGGANVYRDAVIDYKTSKLQPDDLVGILTGAKSDRLPHVIEATGNDNIFIFWSGHGVPGAMCWNEDTHAVTGDILSSIFVEMQRKGCYRRLLMMVEACYSGGVVEKCSGIPGMLFITAANGDETSKADLFDSGLNVWLSNRFTATFTEQIAANPSIGMRDLYYRLFINTVGSHVMVYNAPFYGNLYTSDMSEFINCRQ